MILALLPILGHSFSKGYHTFTVTYDQPFYIKLSKNILVFALDEAPPASVNFTVIDRHNKSLPIPLSSYTHMQFFQTSIFISVPKHQKYTLHFWLIPPNLCHAISYSAIADHTLSFELVNDDLKTDFCIFSQSGSSGYKTLLQYDSTSSNSSIEFYTHPKEPSKHCKKNKLCKFKTNRPFFIRAHNVANAGFKAALQYKTKRKTIDSCECALTPVPFMIEPPIQVPMGVLSVDNIKCVSMAEVVLRYVTYGSIGVVAGVVALYVMHCLGWINLRVILGCAATKDRFDQLKENPYAQEFKEDEFEEQKEETL